MRAKGFDIFDSWHDVLDHVNAGNAVYYQAPLDAKPVLVRAKVLKGDKLRIIPLSADCDPFTATPEHLPRFMLREAY